MTIDHRMESFANSFGGVPPKARRLDDSEANVHGATWIRRLLGKGIACQYVIGYQLGERWWTFCFEREVRPAIGTGDEERWTVEAYSSLGQSWCETFRFDPDSVMWMRAPETLIREARAPRNIGSLPLPLSPTCKEGRVTARAQGATRPARHIEAGSQRLAPKSRP